MFSQSVKQLTVRVVYGAGTDADEGGRGSTKARDNFGFAVRRSTVFSSRGGGVSFGIQISDAGAHMINMQSTETTSGWKGPEGGKERTWTDSEA